MGGVDHAGSSLTLLHSLGTLTDSYHHADHIGKSLLLYNVSLLLLYIYFYLKHWNWNLMINMCTTI